MGYSTSFLSTVHFQCALYIARDFQNQSVLGFIINCVLATNIPPNAGHAEGEMTNPWWYIQQQAHCSSQTHKYAFHNEHSAKVAKWLESMLCLEMLGFHSSEGL